MKTEDEIRKQLAEIESDERLHYPPATINENVVLAFIQTELETEVKVLKWVLNDKVEKGKKVKNG